MTFAPTSPAAYGHAINSERRFTGDDAMKTLFAALALLTCGLAGATSAQAQAMREISYAYAGPTSYYWDIFIAQERG